jgi:hypothetical protein
MNQGHSMPILPIKSLDFSSSTKDAKNASMPSFHSSIMDRSRDEIKQPIIQACI